MTRVINPLNPGVTVNADIRIPGSKSHTIRALLIAALAEGTSVIREPLISADTLSCLKACRQLGAVIEEEADQWRVKGTGGRLSAPATVIDVGNSGTTLYLATALAAISDKKISFDGDEQIRRRSADNLLNSLVDLGVAVESSAGGCAPYSVTGPLKGGHTVMNCPTSQYLSGLLMSAPLGNGITEIDVPLLYEKPYVTMTLDWLNKQGIRLEFASDYSRFVIPGGQGFRAFDKSVAADFSSATFFLCAAAITGGRILLKGLDMNDSQGDKAVVSMLASMGCPFHDEEGGLLSEPGELVGCDLDLNDTPDALPALAVTACFARGTTRLINVPQARIKETDRIAVMARELSRLGANIEELPDGLVIKGSPLRGGSVSGHGDHRVIMSLALAGLRASGPVTIDDDSAAGITFPGFFDLFERLYRS
jgi:3-phosphoshikimate 1-carboxyvinyltransferase